jgi:hypothetical protein
MKKYDQNWKSAVGGEDKNINTFDNKFIYRNTTCINETNLPTIMLQNNRSSKCVQHIETNNNNNTVYNLHDKIKVRSE